MKDKLSYYQKALEDCDNAAKSLRNQLDNVLIKNNNLLKLNQDKRAKIDQLEHQNKQLIEELDISKKLLEARKKDIARLESQNKQS